MALLKITEPSANQDFESLEEVVVGIDLGTTNSLIAIIENEKVRFFADENGNQIHPSIVDYEGVKISSIKRLMGKSFADVKNQKFDFEIDPDSAQKEVLRLVVGGRKIRPAEVSSEILKHLKNLAEKNLQTIIKKAVITVPAYFDEAAKNATKLAANLAGLEVLRLVNEPTAAALAYGLDNAVEGTYCVFDLGGGTFDVSILKMQKGVFKVLGVAGDNALGGDDFDNLLAEKLAISRAEARKIKEELSSNINESVATKITRQEFENLIAAKLETTFTLTKNLLEDLELESAQIKGVILVGGSTRIPLITKKLSEIFGAEKILDKLDPDRIVAQGAAWQAYNLSGKSQNLLLDVIPLSLGIEMLGGIVDKIIYRNSLIPTAFAKEFTTYADNQTAMKLHIVQGERELAADCRSLAEFEIKNIPAMKAGLARVLVTFKIDADGLLTVVAEDKISHNKQEIIVKPSFGLDENEVKKMLLDSLKNSQSDIANRLLIEARTASAKDIIIIKQDLEKFADYLSEKEKKLIKENLQILENLLTQKASRDSILEAQKQLEKAAENLVLKKVNAVLSEKIAGKKIDQI
jgi:molecular chaperone HscA